MTRDTANALTELNEIADTAAELADLRDTADDILAHLWDCSRTRKLLEGPDAAFDEDLWTTVVELGWPDVLVAEAAGGGGATLRELCVLTEAAGAASLPIPLARAAAAAWCAQSSTDGVTLLLDDAGATSTMSGLSGTWPLVAFGAVATRLIVLATRDGKPTLAVVHARGPGVKVEPQQPLDRNPAATLTLVDAPCEVLCTGDDAVDRHRAALLRAQVATVAELCGIAEAANQAAVEYATVRTTFGRPIGTRQAIKHRLVDQRCAIEVARALVNRAADACEHQHPDAEALVSLAAFWAIDTLRRVPEGASQVFGGIAYTWEHDAHVHLRRAATRVAALGPRAQHRAVVARWLGTR